MYGILRLTMTGTKESTIALLVEYDLPGIVIPVVISIGAVNDPKIVCMELVKWHTYRMLCIIIVLTMDITRTSCCVVHSPP